MLQKIKKIQSCNILVNFIEVFIYLLYIVLIKLSSKILNIILLGGKKDLYIIIYNSIIMQLIG